MDYNCYRLNGKEQLRLIGESALVAMGISWLFYNSLWGLCLFPGIYLLLRKVHIQGQIEKQKSILAEQFMDVLKSAVNALSAGYSMENAWKEAQKEMLLLHGKGALIYPELTAMNRAISMNVPMENTIKEFAIRAGNEDIYEFAEVFRFAKRSGGDFVRIIETTVYRISGKYETKKEIAVLVAAKKLEQRVMNVIPVFILLYLKITSPEYISAIYGNLPGIAFMTVCLAAYVAAIFFSGKILDIEV